jgi:hypothetical protein
MRLVFWVKEDDFLDAHAGDPDDDPTAVDPDHRPDFD